LADDDAWSTVKATLQSVAASAFATNLLVLVLPLHRLFADETPLAKLV
jgi:hypothetical protein